MTKSKLLICGGTGFIGRNLCEYFSRDPSFEVFATCRKPEDVPDEERSLPVEWVTADLTIKEDVKQAVAGMDTVIQAAATTSGAKDIVHQPYLHVTDNVVMNAFLFRACHEAEVRQVIFFSCTTMYQSQEEPVKEEDFRGEMLDKYFGGGWTKVYNEKMCEFYAGLGKTRYIAIRHSNIYGPHDKFDLEKSHVFGATMTKVMTATNGKIVVWGDGSDERDLLYIDDLITFVALVIQEQDQPFVLLNLGSGESVSVRDLVDRIIRHSGRDLTIEYDLTKPSIGFKLSLNIDRAKSLFGWAPETTLDKGIQKTLDWYRRNLLGEQISD